MTLLAGDHLPPLMLHCNKAAQAAKWGWSRWRAREFPACAHALPECRFGMTASGRPAPVRAQPGGFCDWQQLASEMMCARAAWVGGTGD